MEENYTEMQIESMRKLSLILYIITIAAALIMFILVVAQECNIICAGIVLFLLVNLFIKATKLKLFVTSYLVDSLLKICSSNFEFLKYSQDDGIPEKVFNEAGFIKNYTAYQSNNFIFGKLNGKDFIMSDVVVKNRISTSQKNETSVLFNGVFGITDFPNQNNIEMIIGPDLKNKFLNNISEDLKKILGINKKIVKLENHEFERYFEVYCEDQIAARKIITPIFMEKMVDFRKVIKKNVTLIYKNNKIYFTIENKLIVDTRKLYINGINRDLMIETLNFLKLISEIINGLASID